MGTSLNISKDLDLDLEQVIGQCISVLGIRGSGKSNTAGVIFEELLKNNYPMSIVDIEGEYFGLKEKYEVLVVGAGDSAEIEIDADCAAEIAQVSMEKNIPVVLDLSGFLSDERNEILMEYLSSLWNLAGTLRRPYIIGIEEAHEFIPQGVKNELKEMIARVALRGRKRGLGAIIVSQRSAKVDKDVLSQAGMLFLHRVVHEVDMRVYGELLPWKKSEVKEIISALDTGDCIYLNGDTVLPIYVRERATFHAGFTPSLETVTTPELKRVNESIIEAIERARKGKRKKTQIEDLEGKIERLQEMIEQKDSKISELEEVARTLGYIKVEVPEAFRRALDEGRSPSGEPVRVAERLIGARRRDDVARAQTELPVLTDTEEETRDFAVIDIAENRASSIESLPPAVRRHMDRLVQRVGRAPLLDRRLLGFLMEHGPGAYSVEQISAWTSCARGVIEKDPPRDFLDAGLVSRERRSDGIYYRNNLKSFVSREFAVYQPDIGPSGIHVISRALRKRLAVSAHTP